MKCYSLKELSQKERKKNMKTISTRSSSSSLMKMIKYRIIFYAPKKRTHMSQKYLKCVKKSHLYIFVHIISQTKAKAFLCIYLLSTTNENENMCWPGRVKFIGTIFFFLVIL